MNPKALYQFLGLCHKAGAMLSGDQQLRDGLKHKKGKLLLIAEDASPRTIKDYQLMAQRAQIPWRMFGEKEILGSALGKGIRTAVLITDTGFSKALLKKMDAPL